MCVGVDAYSLSLHIYFIIEIKIIKFCKSKNNLYTFIFVDKFDFTNTHDKIFLDKRSSTSLYSITLCLIT